MVIKQIKFLKQGVTATFLGFILFSAALLGQGVLLPTASAESLPVATPAVEPLRPAQPPQLASGLASPNLLITYTLYLPAVLAPAEAPPGEGELGCNPSGGSGGLAAGTITEVTVGGLLSSVVVGDGYDPARPTHLVFFLHGDEGNYSQFQKSTHKVTTLVKERGWVLVAPRAHLSDEGKYSWWQSPEENTASLTAVFEEMFARYNLCQETILAGTLSGGSIFWPRFYFPEKGGVYPAHLILFCGGMWPRTDDRDKVTALGQNPDIVSRSSFKFRYGSDDYLYDRIQDAMTFYSDAGFAVSKQQENGVGHCVTDTAQKMRDFLVDKAAELEID